MKCQRCGCDCEALHWTGIEGGKYDLEVCEVCAEEIHNMETVTLDTGETV